MGRGAWRATVRGITKSRAQLTMCAKTRVQRPQRDERGRPSHTQGVCGLKILAEHEISTRTPTPPPSSLWPTCHPSGPPAATNSRQVEPRTPTQPCSPLQSREREPPREAVSRPATSPQVREVLRHSSRWGHHIQAGT